MARRLDNWIKSYLELVENTEAPRVFWFWSAVFILASTLHRKVWFPYGLENLYPNIYVGLIAPPGERKAHPIKLARKMLMEMQIPVAVDSSSKRTLTKETANAGNTEQFQHPDGTLRRVSALSIQSPELSSLLALNLKEIIEFLTDGFDSPDEWKYKTEGAGYDYMFNVCINLFFATTPTWMSNNLPAEAIGGGFTSRIISILSTDVGIRYKPVPFPERVNERLYKDLIRDLNRIYTLIGEFKIEPAAKRYFEDWYETIPEKLRKSTDERTFGFINRMHILAIKVAMSMHTSYSDELIILVDDMGRAIELLEDVANKNSQALGGIGRSRLGPDVHRVLNQVKLLKTTSLRELLSINFHNLTKSELKEVLETIETMGVISIIHSTKGDSIRWKGKAKDQDTQ